jgi:hypothetical protein
VPGDQWLDAIFILTRPSGASFRLLRRSVGE